MTTLEEKIFTLKQKKLEGESHGYAIITENGDACR